MPLPRLVRHHQHHHHHQQQKKASSSTTTSFLAATTLLGALTQSLLFYLVMYTTLLSPFSKTRSQASAYMTKSLSMSSTSSSGNPKNRVRVVTYNILTPNYATPRDLPTHPVIHLDQEKRLNSVLAKLQAETQQGSVIALQEVSRTWAGHLHVFFAKAGYHFVHSGYGRPSSGYMGVGLAWPLATLEASTIEISRLAEAKSWVPPPPPSAFSQLLRPLKRILGRGGGRGGGGPPSPEDILNAAKDRSNAVIIARLKSKGGSGAGDLDFWIGCYHMPCEFRRPPIMTVHAALLVQRLQQLAGSRPHIVTGDFNFQPSWPQYQIITEGSIPKEHPHYPALPPADTWTPTVSQPLRSALATKWGEEPTFTCYSYADRESGERFCEPLDYIFLSKEWQVLDAVKLQSKEEALKLPCPFPNEEEPSDHVLVWTELGL